MTTRRVTERDLDSIMAEAQRPSKAKADVEQWRRQHSLDFIDRERWSDDWSEVMDCVAADSTPSRPLWRRLMTLFGF